MSKRPTLGLEAVVRPSRLAAKGEAVPATITDAHATPVLAAAAPAPVAPAPEMVASLLDRLAERDALIDQLRAERDELETNLAASDTSTDELRNLVADLRQERERLHLDLGRLIDQHAQERQRLLEEHKAERERLLEEQKAERERLLGAHLAERDRLLQLNELAMARAAASPPAPAAAPSPGPAPSQGMLQRFFGGESKTSTARTLNGRPIL